MRTFFESSNFSPVKRNEPNLFKHLHVEKNELSTNAIIDSYLAADIAEFIRQKLLLEGRSFTYETVMSHPEKIQFLTKALENGYRVYLYYIATEDPEINIGRVNVRVAQNGHFVASEVIRSRYYRSLENLKAAVKQTTRAFIFDNSRTRANLIAEITNGNEVVLNSATQMPNWVAEYLIPDQTK